MNAATLHHLLAVSLLLMLSGCTDSLAKMIVQAPNSDYPAERRSDATPQQLEALYVSKQVRIPVGPPDATLSVWINEPVYDGPQYRIEYNWNTGLNVTKLTRSPTTHLTTRPAAKGTIFILAGIDTDKEIMPYVGWREQLVHIGYQVIQIDLRGHGRSTGNWITYGVVESHDLVQVLDRLQADGLAPGNVGVLGISYGGSVAIEWAAIDPRVKAVVALEPFCTLNDAARDAAPLVLGHWKWLFGEKDFSRAMARAGKLAGFNPDDASPLEAIKKAHQPILLVHSKSDELVPVSHSLRLHDAAPDHTKLMLVEGQSHFTLWYKSAELIRKESQRWFDSFVAHETLFPSPPGGSTAGLPPTH